MTGKYSDTVTVPDRSVLFVPASNASMLSTAWIYGADLYTLDLEDAVAVREKDSARLLAANALRSPQWRDRRVAWTDDASGRAASGTFDGMPVGLAPEQVTAVVHQIGRLDRLCGLDHREVVSNPVHGHALGA